MSPWNSTFTKPGKPLAKKSAKRVIEDRELETVKAFVRDRDFTCQAHKRRTGVPHGGTLVVHHLVPVGRDGTLRNDPENCLLICALSHAWIHDHPKEAEALGLLKSAPLLSPQPNQGQK